MYKEIGEFVWNVGFDRRLYKDGEFWTSLLIGAAMGYWIFIDPSWIDRIRSHFGDLLSVASIVFGFVLSTLFFYIQAAGTWANDKKVSAVAESLVDHHVWTIFSLLTFLAYIVLLWAFGKPEYFNHQWLTGIYSVLVFLGSYCGLQILNQVLTIRWAFRRRHRLLAPGTTQTEVPKLPESTIAEKASGGQEIK
jgi:hypothetical protein